MFCMIFSPENVWFSVVHLVCERTRACPMSVGAYVGTCE
jgi:hypothetical protein